MVNRRKEPGALSGRIAAGEAESITDEELDIVADLESRFEARYGRAPSRGRRRAKKSRSVTKLGDSLVGVETLAPQVFETRVFHREKSGPSPSASGDTAVVRRPVVFWADTSAGTGKFVTERQRGRSDAPDKG